jgi:hypothetical protein
LKIKYSIPIFPVILFDSGIIILQSGSKVALSKQSSNVLHGNISASGSTDYAAK